MALSPIPIIAIVLVLGTDRARTNGPAFTVGWVAGLSTAMAAVLVVAAGVEPDDPTASSVNWLQVALGLAFLALAAKQWRNRPRDGQAPEMPAWMATLDSVTPGRAVLLGGALSGANPKNLALTLSAAAAIANADLDRADSAAAGAAFVAIGSCTVAGAVLAHAIGGERATRPLAAIRQFMTANSAAIMMVIFLILGAKVLGEGLSGVWR